jgi:hypothetical protein
MLGVADGNARELLDGEELDGDHDVGVEAELGEVSGTKALGRVFASHERAVAFDRRFRWRDVSAPVMTRSVPTSLAVCAAAPMVNCAPKRKRWAVGSSVG